MTILSVPSGQTLSCKSDSRLTARTPSCPKSRPRVRPLYTSFQDFSFYECYGTLGSHLVVPTLMTFSTSLVTRPDSVRHGTSDRGSEPKPTFSHPLVTTETSSSDCTRPNTKFYTTNTPQFVVVN